MLQHLSPRVSSGLVAALAGWGLYCVLHDGAIRLGPRHPVDPSQVHRLSYEQAPGMFMTVTGFLALFLVLGLYGLWHYRNRDGRPGRRTTRR